MDEFSKCTKKLESLFVQITNTTAPWYVGVVYRPPSGSKSEAIAELEKLMQCLPNKKVIILEDFNDDLLNPDSLANHFKPGCNPSLIDNILTNSSENIQSAGVFKSGVSHHHPIFCFIKDETPKIENSSNRDPKYDYCESNMNKFECDMEHMHQTNANLDYTEANFIAYVNEIKLKIENIFLIKSESKSTFKRLSYVTHGLLQRSLLVSTKNIFYMLNGGKVSQR